MKIYFTVFLFLIQVQVYSQKAGLVVFVNPSNSVLKIEDVKTKVGSLNFFDPSLKTIKLWSPRYKVLIDTVRVVDNKVIYKREKLVFSEEYKGYLKERNRQLKPFIRSAFISGFLLFVYEANRFGMKKAEQKVKDNYTFYYSSFSVGEIEKTKSAYESSLDKYNKKRNLNNILATAAYIIIPSSLVYSTYYYFKHHKRYTEKPNPEFAVTPGLGIDNFGNVTTTFNLKF